MTIKVHFNQEIHRFTKLSPNLESFLDAINSTFKHQLPKLWTLSYTDLEGDTILVSHESDYEELVAIYSQNVSTTMRLYVIPVDPQMQKGGHTDQLVAKNEKSVESKEESQDENNLKSNQIQGKDEICSQNNGEKRVEAPASAENAESNKEGEPQATPQPIIEEDETLKKSKVLLTKLMMGQVADDKKDLAIAKLKKFEETLTVGQKEELQKRREEIDAVLVKRKLKEEKLAAKSVKEQNQKEESKEALNAISDSNPQAKLNEETITKITQVKCNECQAILTSGVVYKCSKCVSFYFCEACEASKPHPHLFLKVRDLSLLEQDKAPVKKAECPYAVFQRLVEDLKKGNVENVKKGCARYLSKLPEDMRTTLTSLFGNLSEETKEKVKEAVIGLKEKAFGKENCSCVEEREKLREDQKVFKEQKQKFAKDQKESKLKLKEEWNAFRMMRKNVKEKIAEEWKKIKEKKKEDAEKLKEQWTKLKEKIALEKEKVAQKKKGRVEKENKGEQAGKVQECHEKK